MRTNVRRWGLLAMVLVSAGMLNAAIEDYNCRTAAVQIVTQENTWQSFKMVRQWNENMRTVKPGNPPEVIQGGWSDGGGDSMELAKQIGCCWLRVSLT